MWLEEFGKSYRQRCIDHFGSTKRTTISEETAEPSGPDSSCLSTGFSPTVSRTQSAAGLSPAAAFMIIPLQIARRGLRLSSSSIGVSRIALSVASKLFLSRRAAAEAMPPARPRIFASSLVRTGFKSSLAMLTTPTLSTFLNRTTRTMFTCRLSNSLVLASPFRLACLSQGNFQFQKTLLITAPRAEHIRPRIAYAPVL